MVHEHVRVSHGERAQAEHDQRTHEAEERDVAEIAEEILFAHVEACGENDRGQDVVEDDVRLDVRRYRVVVVLQAVQPREEARQDDDDEGLVQRLDLAEAGLPSWR